MPVDPVEEILLSALEVPAEERPAILDTACARSAKPRAVSRAVDANQGGSR